jgi:DNA invertase Pin-like site-specific DNA recombinase
MSNTKRAALYVRVSTDAQTVENQIRELRQVGKRRGWDVVEVYSDAGISGAKGRNGRPGLDSMLKDASRRKFDVVMAWAIDRLGRSLSDLLDTIQHLEACGVDLYLDQQAIDTTIFSSGWVSERRRKALDRKKLSLVGIGLFR